MQEFNISGWLVSAMWQKTGSERTSAATRIVDRVADELEIGDSAIAERYIIVQIASNSYVIILNHDTHGHVYLVTKQYSATNVSELIGEDEVRKFTLDISKWLEADLIPNLTKPAPLAYRKLSDDTFRALSSAHERAVAAGNGTLACALLAVRALTGNAGPVSDSIVEMVVRTAADIVPSGDIGNAWDNAVLVGTIGDYIGLETDPGHNAHLTVMHELRALIESVDVTFTERGAARLTGVLNAYIMPNAMYPTPRPVLDDQPVNTEEN